MFAVSNYHFLLYQATEGSTSKMERAISFKAYRTRAPTSPLKKKKKSLLEKKELEVILMVA